MLWRKRLSAAQRSLELARLEVDRVFTEGRKEKLFSPERPLALEEAMGAEDRAASEYLRVLKLLTVRQAIDEGIGMTCILVLEDEPFLMTSLRQLLERYTLLEA